MDSPQTAALSRAIDKLEGAANLARALNVSVQAINQWKTNLRPVPPERKVEIERLTGGEVPVEEYAHPDERWIRITDVSWPHQGGRPLLDVATAPKAQAPDTTEAKAV